jgi:hypothetical protein
VVESPPSQGLFQPHAGMERVPVPGPALELTAASYGLRRHPVRTPPGPVGRLLGVRWSLKLPGGAETGKQSQVFGEETL